MGCGDEVQLRMGAPASEEDKKHSILRAAPWRSREITDPQIIGAPENKISPRDTFFKVPPQGTGQSGARHDLITNNRKAFWY